MPRTIVLSTCGSMREARKIGNDLVKRRLAACVNILPVTSCYRWKSKIKNEKEWLIIIKTRSEAFGRLMRRIRALHSYELPEILSVRIEDGLQSYLAWIDGEVRAKPP